MISKINNSMYLKHVACLLAVSILFMSFNTRGNDGVVLSAGTNILLETVPTLQTDIVAVGQTIDFKVKNNVVAEGKTLIAAGSIAKGQIVRAQKAKGIGKQGFIEIQLISVAAVDGQEVFLSGGNVYQEGENRETLSIVLSVFVCLLFLTLKGTEAFVPSGYQVTSTVATTISINA
jgi:hypothetical protein